ncbi:MAG TPA: hypothetical protein VFC02_02830 [Anaerolineales bacterium]|nr:hypothetical protein [Anaerolineales bacterium]
MNPQQNKRMIFIIVGIVDAVISGAILLIYFGLLPIDISELGVPRWVIGVIGGVWFLGAIGFVVYQLTRTDISE